MTATTTSATYNFDELYAKVFDSSPERVANTEQPTVQGVLRYLSDKLDGKRFVRSHKPNERALYNAGIIIDEPLAPGTKRGRYAQWWRQCTGHAKRFYLDLQHKVHADELEARRVANDTPKALAIVPTVCRALIVFGYDAKHDPIRHMIESILYAEHAASIQGQRLVGVPF